MDTDALTTRIFSNRYYGPCPRRVEEIIQHPDNQNNLYLVTNIDVPWVPDTSRDLGTPELRARMQTSLLKALKNRGTLF